MGQDQQQVSPLFAGEPQPFGGLSNERELVRLCPNEFKRGDNPWTQYVQLLVFSNAKTSNWKWKVDDPEVKEHQIECFRSLMGGFDLSHQDKERVASWMLSEMLETVPELTKPEPKRNRYDNCA